MNNDIHEAIQFIISSLEKQGQAPGTLKNYINSFHVFEQYLEENSICEVNERICLEYIQFKTGKKINSFRGTTLDPNLNRRMKPLHLLLMYLETGTFHYEPRKQVQLFQCPSDYLEIYQSFEEYCNARGYADATKDLNIRHVRNLLLYLESQDIKELGQITASCLETFLHTYDKVSVKYVGTVLYVLRNFGHFCSSRALPATTFPICFPKSGYQGMGRSPIPGKKMRSKNSWRLLTEKTQKGNGIMRSY